MKVANRPLTRTRHGFTLSAEQLMEEAARREMGGRIKELRQRSPWKQHHMADKLHVGLRMYQRLEHRGSTEWERIEEIAAIHEVDPRWIWSGAKQGVETPDVMKELPGPEISETNGSSEARLQRIEEALERMEARQVEALAVVASIRHDLPARPSRRKQSEDDEAVSGN